MKRHWSREYGSRRRDAHGGQRTYAGISTRPPKSNARWLDWTCTGHKARRCQMKAKTKDQDEDWTYTGRTAHSCQPKDREEIDKKNEDPPPSPPPAEGQWMGDSSVHAVLHSCRPSRTSSEVLHAGRKCQSRELVHDGVSALEKGVCPAGPGSHDGCSVNRHEYWCCGQPVSCRLRPCPTLTQVRSCSCNGERVVQVPVYS
jgi:hypothetical protein